MGFETVIAAIISIALIITVAYAFASGSVSLTESSSLNYKQAVKEAIKTLHSGITITGLTYDNSTLRIISHFKNTGETKFKDFDKFDVILYGTTESGSRVAEYLDNTTYSITSELINPGIFDPHEVAELEAQVWQLENGTYVLMICSPNAICDSLEFTVGG
jgi:flagellar protein FlaF